MNKCDKTKLRVIERATTVEVRLLIDRDVWNWAKSAAGPRHTVLHVMEVQPVEEVHVLCKVCGRENDTDHAVCASCQRTMPAEAKLTEITQRVRITASIGGQQHAITECWELTGLYVPTMGVYGGTMPAVGPARFAEPVVDSHGEVSYPFPIFLTREEAGFLTSLIEQIEARLNEELCH
ncbi:MAG: hypothetical protein MOB07_31575 [Acidobacteria bacterium]|nr:hypothetical protein [Acidobacteriota bacterium]